MYKLATQRPSMATPRHKLPIRMISTVVRGYGRGSRELGIPTANLCRETLQSSVDFDDLPCGIYWGFAKVGSGRTPESETPVCKAAISIGYNPTYKNEQKTVEPHLIADPADARRNASLCGETLLRDFYGETIRLSVVGFLRNELPFEGLEKLVAAIKKDIVDSERLCDGTDAFTRAEQEWVGSSEGVV